MKKQVPALAIACLITGFPGAHAASGLDDLKGRMPSDYKRLKLGLWEETRRSESVTPPVDLSGMDMSHFSPEERARVEAVLKRQAEERKARGDAPRVTTRTKRTCMTAEKMEKNMREMDPARGDRNDKEVQCTYRVKENSSSRLLVASECTIADAGLKAGPYAGGGKFSGEIAWEIKSPEWTIASTSSEGRMGSAPIKNRDVVESHWIGSDCGNVR